jgi:hypothetical protein
MSVIRQLSLFGADAATPEPGNLAGLLAAGASLTIRDGIAQVSVLVDHPWRAAALVAECARRGIAATSVSTTAEHIAVRTAFTVLLAPLAQRWLVGADQRVPPDLRLDGLALRLWVLAGGRAGGALTGTRAGGALTGTRAGGALTGTRAGGTDTSFLLPVGPVGEVERESLGAALAQLGLAAQLAVGRGGAAALYRIVGKRRLGRLAELIGDPPRQAPADIWPS